MYLLYGGKYPTSSTFPTLRYRYFCATLSPMKTMTLDEVTAMQAPTGFRRVDWSAVAEASTTGDDPWVFVSVPTAEPMRTVSNLAASGRAWGKANGYTVAASKPRDWTGVAFRFTKATS